MFKKFSLFAIVFLLASVHSSPVENPTKSETQSDTSPPSSSGKSITASKKEGAKFAASLADQDYARTHNKIMPILQHKIPMLLQPFSYKPAIFNPVEHLQPAVKPVAPIYPSVISHPQPVFPKPIPFIPEPVFTKPSIPFISEPVFTKPSIHVADKPDYTISSQIIHKPVLTDHVEIVRRPVLSEVLQVIHKPILTEEQKVIKLPNYVSHVVEKPHFTSIKNEVHGQPILLPAQHYDHLDKLQYVPPVTTEVVQIPHQHVPSHGSVGYGKPNILGSLGLGGSGTSYGVNSASPSYNVGSYYGVGSALPSYVGYGNGINSAVPSYVGSGYGLSSAVPSYVGSGYGSAVPSYVGSSYGLGSAVPSYVGSLYGSGSAIQNYYGISGAGQVTSAGHGGEPEGVVNAYIEPAPGCRSDDCKTTMTTQYVASEYSQPMVLAPTMWYDTAPGYVQVQPVQSGKSSESEAEQQPDNIYVSSATMTAEREPFRGPVSQMTSLFMSDPGVQAQLRDMFKAYFFNISPTVSPDNGKQAEEKPTGKPKREDVVVSRDNEEQSKVKTVEENLKDMTKEELKQVEEAVHNMVKRLVPKSQSEQETETSQATVRESTPNPH